MGCTRSQAETEKHMATNGIRPSRSAPYEGRLTTSVLLTARGPRAFEPLNEKLGIVAQRVSWSVRILLDAVRRARGEQSVGQAFRPAQAAVGRAEALPHASGVGKQG